MEYRLVSVKSEQHVDGTKAEAIQAAIMMEQTLQPTYGVTVEDAQGNTVAEIQDGAVVE